MIRKKIQDVGLRSDYLVRLMANQNERMAIIENKLSQVTSQSGLAISVTSLFIPLLFNELSEADISKKIILLIFFILTVVGFILSIIHSTKTLDISKFSYCDGNPEMAIRRFDDKDGFQNEMNNDLVASIIHNTEVNNEKGTHLLSAQKFFRFGIILMTALIACIILSTFR
jgi:hypothetical protein